MRFVLCLLPLVVAAAPAQLEKSCFSCHSGKSAQGGLDLASLPFDMRDRGTRDRWIRIHDRVEKGEMPPVAKVLPPAERTELLKTLAANIFAAEQADIKAGGRGPLRRLNRDEYEQNLRDILHLPNLDIRDILPADRESHHFNKTSESLDMSRVQLAAYLDAADTALRQAMVTSPTPPPVTKYRAVGLHLFSSSATTGERESMFFARNNKAIDLNNAQFREQSKNPEQDPTIELGLFRSPGWPYSAFPQKFAAQVPGQYRVRFSARAVRQLPGFTLTNAVDPVPMTFRSRKPTNQDTAEDTRNTGGNIDIRPEGGVYETTVLLGLGQTIEYGMLGLPVPAVDAFPKISGSYRFPPFPPGGHPGVMFQWLEIEGPIAPPSWPPPSHKVLFDELGPNPQPPDPQREARRLLQRFIRLATNSPIPADALRKFEPLILSRLQKNEPFAEAMLAGYKAYLCSVHFLYLPEPTPAQAQYPIAFRLSHFLTNSRPDEALAARARDGKLRDPQTLNAETDRLIASPAFDRFVNSFTDYWLNLRHVRRDDPDIRLYPEYRLDEYLVESMDAETRAFFTAMMRENLPASTLVQSDFTFVNDRLSRHYGLAPLTGSALRKVRLPPGSPYGGLLTQAAILKVSANGTTTSPVIRGAWVMDRLIGNPPPPPPPGVPAVEPDIRGAKSIREQLALHTKSQTCAACHAKFDPVGLALENFDVMGAWRPRYRGLAEGERVTGIDRSGHDFAYTIAARVDPSGTLLDGRNFRDIHELKALFAANPRQLARNLVHQFTVYSTGTPVRFADRAEVESILDACAPNGYRVRDLMKALVRSKIFLGQSQ